MLRMYSETGSKDVPDELIPAVESVRDKFLEANDKCRQTTQQWCYALLHPEQRDKVKEALRYNVAVKQLASSIPKPALEYFKNVLRENTPAASLAAFFYLYVEGVAVQVRLSFKTLLRIAEAHEKEINMPAVPWVARQVKSMIHAGSSLTGSWLKNCCDVQPYDPNDQPEENYLWLKWLSPKFVRMQPGIIGRPFDSATAWDRDDIETSLAVVRRFTEAWVLYLEECLKNCEGQAIVNAASKPVQPQDIKSPGAENGCHGIEGDTSNSRKRSASNKRKTSVRQGQKDALMRIALRKGRVGRQYCQDVDDVKVPAPPEWFTRKWPGSYVKAYDAPQDGVNWRQLIQDEKYRYSQKFAAKVIRTRHNE